MAWSIFTHRTIEDSTAGTEELFRYEVEGDSEYVAEVTYKLQKKGHRISAVLPDFDAEPEQEGRSRKRR